MKLIIPIEFYRKGGVERVIISLVTELTRYVDQIILVLPKKDVSYFSKLLPASDAIVYETFGWEHSTVQSKILKTLQRAGRLAQVFRLKGAEKAVSQLIRHANFKGRINQLIKDYSATHCLYLLTNRLTPPNVNVPLMILAHDVFWRFAPLTYSDDYIREYDENLLTWLKAADLTFTNSDKTRKDVLSIYPEFDAKIKPIPLAGFQHDYIQSVSEPTGRTQPIFYFPSSFGIYKDHLTLLRAAMQLADKGYQFKVILVGKETDGLVNNQLTLTQQSKTQEYTDYIQACRQFYATHQHRLATYVDGLGYCTYEQVEQGYQSCSCVVVPSQYEGFGLPVAEAIARGVPAIASDLEVFREQVELYQCPDRVDFFPPGDADALAACMERFILNRKPKLPSEQLRQRFSHWTWDDVAKQYVTSMAQLQ